MELNRETLKEGSSLILTLTKTISSNEDKTKRINVRKIASLKDLFNSSIKEVTLNIKSKEQLKEIQSFLDENGETIVHINFSSTTETQKFRLKSFRKIDRKSINILRIREIGVNIH